MTIDYNRYYRHDELTAHLHTLAEAYPHLARLSSIGQSHHGRDLWCMTITNFATGAPENKPAFYIDGNNHGREVVTSAVAFFTIGYVLERYGHDPFVTELVDTRTLYILPRVNPDGAEISLTTPYDVLGNGHYLPWDEQPKGLHISDLDEDGRILQMRIPDPKGEWQVSEIEPRLLVLRGPGDLGGAYYRLLPEGVFRDWDGVTQPIMKARHGNLNRQFPVNWAPEYGEYGAGELPLNEPEAAAMARFVLDHPNITGLQAYHSHSGVILRVSSHRRDHELDPLDVQLFKTLGRMGTELTGYPVISIYEDFTELASKPRHGGFGEWVYEHLGIVSFATELWDVETEMGIRKPQFFPNRPRSEEELKLHLAWADEHAPGSYVDWYPIDHPQLGRVELGGWQPMYLQINPPPAYLHTLYEPNALFTLRHAAASPLVRVSRVEAERIADDLYKLSAVVENQGYLPTNLTQRALSIDIAQPVTVQVQADGDVEFILGKAETSIGHLGGRVERTMPYDAWRRPWREQARLIEWMIRAPAGTTLTVEAASEKGGRHSAMTLLA
ncbi:MAG: peptidase M14 [Anaerolineae bacterium]|nr:peptidase M14 [Anaerolineae bacterium]